MSVFGEITLAVVIAVLGWWLWKKNNKNKDYFKNIPGPPTIPILGNALELGSTIELLHVLQRYTRNHGDIVKVQVGPFRKLIIVSDYKFLECILSSMKLLNKSDDYLHFRPWLGTGLLTSDGSKWKTHRRILTPAFHFQILEQFVEVFESCGEILIDRLQEHTDKNNIDVYSYVTLCALDIICESTMGINVNAQLDEGSDYVKSVKAMTRIIIERAISPLQMYDFLFPLSRNYYTQKKALKILHAQSNEVIKQRQEKLHEKSSSSIEDAHEKKKKAFLDLLLGATVDGRPLTQEEIREEVDTFMFEGHDTTASAISFALFSLANNPEVQAKAYEEQKQIFSAKTDSTITYTDLQNMKYLEQVIKETLRLYPSVPFYARETNKEVEYEGINLPQGETLVLFAYGIQRDPKYFTNPDDFIPERFDTIDGKLPYAYIPFSAGPRNCIGQKFAMLELKCTLSKVLRKFELRPAVPTHVLKLSAESVLKSANGVKIGLSARSI